MSSQRPPIMVQGTAATDTLSGRASHALPTTSPFVDLLSPELRLQIYTHLLVADCPIAGRHARRTTNYDLCTSILRVNRQIHLEARTVFLGKNTFRITSVPSAGDDTDSGAFEPPLQPKDLPLIRCLEIDMLYYPRHLRTERADHLSWKPVCPAAERYVSSITHLLGFVKSTLLALRFVTDTRPYAGAEDEAAEGDALDVKKMLTAFHIAESSARFNKVLAGMPMIRHIAVCFLFPESYFSATLGRDELAQRSLFFLACQVVFARSEMRLKAVLETLEEEMDGEVEEVSVTDLAQRVALEWPSDDTVAVVQRATAVLEMMK